MKPKFYLSDLAMLAVIILPLIYLCTIYRSLPPQVATHFNFRGTGDKIEDKSTLWMILFITSLVCRYLYTF